MNTKAGPGGSRVGDDTERDVADVLEVLASRIASHDIAPGSRLREHELAEEFGVPRTRIREALSALDERGLIDRVPNRGAVVARFDVAQLSLIYDVREVLEGLCARRATENAAPGTWDDLIGFFDDQMQTFVDNGDLESFVAGYERFRVRTIEVAANPVLAGLLDSIYEKTQVAIRRIVILPGRPEKGLAEHRAVLAAMAAGDGPAAERLRRKNMRNAKEHLLRYQTFVL